MTGLLGPISVTARQGGGVRISSVVGEIDHSRGLDQRAAINLARAILDAVAESEAMEDTCRMHGCALQPDRIRRLGNDDLIRQGPEDKG